MENNIMKELQKEYKFLVKGYEEIDKAIYIAPHSAIIKGRTLGEQIAKEVAILENMNYLSELLQSERLRELAKQTDIEKNALDLFHDIRKIGNIAAHEKIESESGYALLIHNKIYKLLCWFVEVYLDPYIKPDEYVEPKNNTKDNEIEKLKEEIEKIKVISEVKPSTEINVSIKETTKESSRECLIDELGRLRQSSKEAVESVTEFSEFKKYMHVTRDVQEELEEIVKRSNESSIAQLILVCGSVGDGKSHIISYIKNEYPEIIENFEIDNDATESLLPNQTSTEKLSILLDEFSDEKIKTSTKKFILAINLGTLTNFIDSEYGEKFSILKDFVREKKILDTSIEENRFDENSNIQFINFTDYHLFTLKDGKVNSEYIKNLLGKVVDKVEGNFFYKSYKANCGQCQNALKCPIKANYEFLGENEIKESIVDLLVQGIIKKKIIVSTRALLNFIYELIVSRIYIDINNPMFKKSIEKLKPIDYMKSLTPNIMFEHRDLSFIFKALSEIDPVNTRNEKVDEFIVKFNNSENIIEFFDDHINYPKGYLEKIRNEEMKKETKQELLKLFIRSYYMCGYGELFELNDFVYEEYIKNLYYWNKGEKPNLREMYQKIKDGIMTWNGKSLKGNVNIFVGKNQIKYKVSEELELKAKTDNIPSNSNRELKKFITTIQVAYKTDKIDTIQGISIDFALYELLNRVIEGYRPNKKDRNQFINFIEYIKKLEELGSQKKEVSITEKNREHNKKYKLEYDEEFEQYRFVEI